MFNGEKIKQLNKKIEVMSLGIQKICTKIKLEHLKKNLYFWKTFEPTSSR